MVYTVILMYPKHLQDTGHDTFMTPVRAANPTQAVFNARAEMRDSNLWEADEIGDDDMPVVAVMIGDCVDVKDEVEEEDL